ncbi:integrase [Roseovarius sp. MBR-51]
MTENLTDSFVQGLVPNPKRNQIYYDSRVKGFGVRITAAGAKSFVLNYRTRSSRQRRITIGSFPIWKTAAARHEAARLRRDVDIGLDPLDERDRERNQVRFDELCHQYLDYSAPPRLRQSTYNSYKNMIAQEIAPALGTRFLSEIVHEDIVKLHQKITRRGKPYHANRVLALLSRMFNLAIRWNLCTDNPANGTEKNQEIKRQRYLSTDELQALGVCLERFPDQQAANIVRMLLLTGARKGEALAARWEQFDLKVGVWTKPGAMTKQKTEHRVPLSGAAVRLLQDIQAGLAEDEEWVFPSKKGTHREDIKSAWRKICEASGFMEIVETPHGKYLVKHTVRVHDLRHTYASLLASAGHSLPIIGALLGHTQTATTARYAHLLDDPLRAATEKVGVLLGGSPMEQGSGDSSRVR